MNDTKALAAEQVAALKVPLPKEAVSQHPTKKYLSSIKTIYMVERLNEVFGIGHWFMANEVVESAEMVVVKGTLTVPEYGIVIEQFGGNDNADRGDAYKGACTDALSKCCSYLGIGMDVYKGLADKPHAETTDERVSCFDCGKPVTGITHSANGKKEFISAQRILSAGKAQYGKDKNLCGYCQIAREKMAKVEEPKKEPTPIKADDPEVITIKVRHVLDDTKNDGSHYRHITWLGGPGQGVIEASCFDTKYFDLLDGKLGSVSGEMMKLRVKYNRGYINVVEVLELAGLPFAEYASQLA